MKFPGLKDALIEKRYAEAKDMYAALNVDVEGAIDTLLSTPISMHCWQGDDVAGFESLGCGHSGGTLVTGNHPGVAKTPEELRADIDKAMSLLPGKQKLNLHASYLETNGEKVERDEISSKQFSNWIDWAKQNEVGLDFNPTFFAHPKSENGFTLSNQDKGIRDFWIEHALRCREISADFAKELNDDVVVNYWIPDGYKDIPADRLSPRQRLADSYDKIFKDDIDPRVKEAVESKVFGIGSEEYVVGSWEFYMSYALTRKKLVCMDMGHYHPTEGVADKISSILNFLDEALIHVSRPIRWDSDHVVIQNDDLQNLMKEIVRCDALKRVYLATDFFDASINRISAWVTGIRATQKALLIALLEPKCIQKLELEGELALRLAMMEETKALPFGDIWNYVCLKTGVPAGAAWINDVTQYEKDVLFKRK